MIIIFNGTTLDLVKRLEQFSGNDEKVTLDFMMENFKIMKKPMPMPLIKLDIAIQDGLYIATSEYLPGLFIADKNIIDLFNEIPEVIKAIHKEQM